MNKKKCRCSFVKHKSSSEMNEDDSLDFSDIKLNYKRIFHVSKRYINFIVKNEVVRRDPNFIYRKSCMFTSELTYKRCAVFKSLSTRTPLSKLLETSCLCCSLSCLSYLWSFYYHWSFWNNFVLDRHIIPHPPNGKFWSIFKLFPIHGNITDI